MAASKSLVAATGTTARIAHTPIRTCVGCRRQAPKGSLVRPAARYGNVVADARAPGRGVYVRSRAHCLEQALRRQAVTVAAAATAHDGSRRQGDST